MSLVVAILMSALLPLPHALPATESTPSTARDLVVGATVSPLTFRVFATREGLVGHRTANGHTIAADDRFVALPSRRALNITDSSRAMNVSICADNGLCTNAPVWDVGPWNTTDDYWNLPASRAMWRDLPHGTPESQVAYESGYNGGADATGRKVLNPAGIDLADGTFWRDLGLTTNSWVNVTYLWTGGVGAAVRTFSGGLNVRTRPTTDSPVMLTLSPDAIPVLNCEITGSTVAGVIQTTSSWYRIAEGGYVAGGFVDAAGAAPGWCLPAAPPLAGITVLGEPDLYFALRGLEGV
jgi:hypothetical protein